MGNPVLIGQYDYTLDTKNRLVVPPRFRELLTQEKGTHIIVAEGIDEECIYFFLPTLWEQFLVDLKELAKKMPDKGSARAAFRHFFNSARELEVDDQGRILVPESMKEHARLKKDVMVTGSGNKAEIWDSERYRHMDKDAKPKLKKLAAEMGF